MDPNFDTSLLTQEQIDNILIAEYMGGQVESWYPPAIDYGMSGLHVVFPVGKERIVPDNKSWHCASLLKYNNDWNWLIPVLKAIYNDKSITNDFTEQLFNTYFWLSFDFNIKEVFSSVVYALKNK